MGKEALQEGGLMAKQQGKELGDGKPENERGGSKKDGKEETKAEPPGPPPIGLIELVKICLFFKSPGSKIIFAVQVLNSP